MIEPGVYRHYKGKLYEVVGVSLHSESLEALVVYRALYEGEFPKDQLWVRPVSDFCGAVYITAEVSIYNVSGGKNVPRFIKLRPHEILMELEGEDD